VDVYFGSFEDGRIEIQGYHENGFEDGFECGIMRKVKKEGWRCGEMVS